MVVAALILDLDFQTFPSGHFSPHGHREKRNVGTQALSFIDFSFFLSYYSVSSLFLALPSERLCFRSTTDDYQAKNELTIATKDFYLASFVKRLKAIA